MNDFVVGDKIRAIATENECGYRLTNSDRNWEGEVLNISNDGTEIYVQFEMEYSDNVFGEWVEARFFEKINGGGRHAKRKGKRLQYQI